MFSLKKQPWKEASPFSTTPCVVFQPAPAIPMPDENVRALQRGALPALSPHLAEFWNSPEPSVAMTLFLDGYAIY